MKNTIKNILILFTVAISLIACDKNELTVLNPAVSTTVSLSATNVVLDKANAGIDALTVSWTDPDYGFNAGANYKIIFSTPEKSVTYPAGTNLSKVFETVELNKILLNLGLKGNVVTQVSIQIVAVLSQYSSFNSNTATFNATAYVDKLDLSTIWGVVGSGYNNWGATPDAPFFTTNNPDIIVSYVTLVTGEIKFRTNNAWDLNYGDDGLDGTLDQNGANIPVTAGTYKITLNTNSLTYTMEAYTWGLVGSATTNGWGGPDMPLMYDSYSDTWKAIVTLGDGEVKFRFNNAWDVNYGDDGLNGTVELNGANIPVTAGNYLVTFDLVNLEYTIASIDIWGLVGSAAPNGWGGPDARFTLDFSKNDVWVLKGVTLIDGEIKFRLNDLWDVNYGDDGLNGTLEANGANIPVTAGVYDITLDFSTTPATYTIM